MAKKIKHLLHRRSLQSSPFTINIERDTLDVHNPKAPLAENIEYGELAVNYGKGHEGLFLKNNENEIVQLNTMKHIRYDGAVDKSFKKYLDDRYVNRSGNTMYGDFTIVKDIDTDDPKFRYIGTYFGVNGVTSEISGETLNVVEDVNIKVNTSDLDITCNSTNINGKLNVTDDVTLDKNLIVIGTITASDTIYSSDKALKKNIKNINKYDIATVADVDLKSYKFIDDETHRERYGVIAQDLESVGLEHLVVTNQDGKKGVDYISFLILKIAQLEKEIKELKNKK